MNEQAARKITSTDLKAALDQQLEKRNNDLKDIITGLKEIKESCYYLKDATQQIDEIHNKKPRKHQNLAELDQKFKNAMCEDIVDEVWTMFDVFMKNVSESQSSRKVIDTSGSPNILQHTNGDSESTDSAGEKLDDISEKIRARFSLYKTNVADYHREIQELLEWIAEYQKSVSAYTESVEKLTFSIKETMQRNSTA